MYVNSFAFASNLKFLVWEARFAVIDDFDSVAATNADMEDMVIDENGVNCFDLSTLSIEFTVGREYPVHYDYAVDAMGMEIGEGEIVSEELAWFIGDITFPTFKI